ncbi:MAG: rRNA synthase, partial [Thermoleophilaceae bacterium]|nr:rRNA synthase [Thermoleophilaceae bacterium]
MGRDDPRFDLEIGPADAGKRLDLVLSSLPRIGSRAAAQRLIRDGAVTVDGVVRPKSHVATEGECVRVTLAP